MFQKITLIAIAAFSMACITLRAQSLVVETFNGGLASEDLGAVQNFTFPGHNLAIGTDDGITSYSLLSVKKIYFSPATATVGPAASDAEMALFPNPGTGAIRITNAPDKPTTLTAFSIQGAKALQVQVSASDSEIDVSRLPAGLYIIRIGGQALKFIKL